MNKIKVTSSGTTRYVTSRKHSSNMVEGDPVCKFGKITYFDCGTIETINFDPDGCIDLATPTYMRVHPYPGSGDMGETGDSGGPVFHDNPAKAWGETVCGFEVSPDMVFMPQNYFADIGVQVKIS